jgi:hypothetical protein
MKTVHNACFLPDQLVENYEELAITLKWLLARTPLMVQDEASSPALNMTEQKKIRNTIFVKNKTTKLNDTNTLKHVDKLNPQTKVFCEERRSNHAKIPTNLINY